MRIAVIGAGRVGQALAGAFTRAGHEVMLSASSPESAKEKAQVVGASAAASNQEAGERAEVIVLAVWYGQHEAVAADIVDVAHGKVVVDVSVPVTADMSGLATEAGPSAAERLAERLPGGKIVKAFNTVFATVQAHPDLHGVTADAFVAADDSDVKRTVLELAASIGLRPIDAGPLRHARYLEAVGCLGIFLNVTNDCLAMEHRLEARRRSGGRTEATRLRAASRCGRARSRRNAGTGQRPWLWTWGPQRLSDPAGSAHAPSVAPDDDSSRSRTTVLNREFGYRPEDGDGMVGRQTRTSSLARVTVMGFPRVSPWLEAAPVRGHRRRML